MAVYGARHDAFAFEASNAAFSKIRAAIERAVAHLKAWRMLSEEGGRLRPPIEELEEALQAIAGLMFFSTSE
jgi:hypothetical protein